ncbi:MAG: formate dehydrogenase accessory sulfurtransferase FdhD [Infirmifilum sp.]
MTVFHALPLIYQDYLGQAVAVDEPYELYVNGKLYASLAANPAALRELAVGLLVGDGVAAPEDITSIEIRGDERVIEVLARKAVDTAPGRIEDCSSAAAKGVHVSSQVTLKMAEILELVGEFDREVLETAKLLAVHSSALFSLDRQEGVVAHDPSRHVSVLKALGAGFLRGYEMSFSILLTTGRASSDIVVRLARVGVPVLVSLKGPLMSGLKAAELLGVTLVLRVRTPEGGKRLAPVSHAWRIKGI